MAATIDTYIEAYWSGLTVALAALNDDLMTSLKAQAAAQVAKYDTSSLSSDELLAVRALMVCIEAGGMSALDEWSEDRHYSQTVNLAKVNKPASVDPWIGELTRKLARCRYSGDDGTIAARYAVKYRRPSVHIAPRLDQNEIPGIDSEASDFRPDILEDMDMEGP
jgi:hypothetical protein